jgi:hypothetical protein
MMAVVRARVLLCCLLIACSRPTHEIRSWNAIDRTGVRAPVTLPDRLWNLAGTNDATLRTHVDLGPDLRGHSLTFVVPCFHGQLRLLAEGTEIADDGSIEVGEHRYVIPAQVTDRRSLELALVLGPPWDGLPSILVAPYLEQGASRRPSAVAQLSSISGIAALGVDALLGALYGIIYLLDRRRGEHAAFAVMTLALIPNCLQQVGLLWPIVGVSSPGVVGISVAIFLLGGVSFIDRAFARRPSRAMTLLLGANVILNYNRPFHGLASRYLGGPIMVVAFVYALWQLTRLARHGDRREDARLLLLGWSAASVLAIVDLTERLVGYRLAGIHLTPPSVIAFVVVHAFVLARQQVARRTELEHTAAELQHQIVERSRELSEALAQLARRAENLERDRMIDGRYRVLCERGSGASGTVYEVERKADGQRFALKTLRHADPAALARFAREAELAASVSHPNLVPVLDVGIAEGALFLVMPLVDEGSLEDSRARFGDAAWALPLLVQIAEGLAALHHNGIIHRDLKPANVLLAGSVPRIADFGIAVLRDVDVLAAPTLRATSPQPLLTRGGDTIGTPRYMAPELSGGANSATTAADLYALGVIAKEMLFAVDPGEPLPTDTSVPPTVRELVARCVEPEPSRRPTAAEVVRHLREA